MSYAVTATGASKQAALDAILAQLDQVLVSQPIHAADIEKAKATVTSIIGVLPEPGEGEVITASASGWVSWEGGSVAEDGSLSEGARFAGVSVSATANIRKAT